MKKDLQNSAMLHAIRGLLKSFGYTHKDVAETLGLSTDTVKRLLNGKVPITLDRMMEICDLLKIDMYELARISKYGLQSTVPALTIDQEKTLASDDGLFAIFYLVVMGVPLENISKEYTFTKEQVLKYALKLEALGILELHPKDKLKMTVYRKSRWNWNGPLHRKFMVPWAEDFAGQVIETAEAFKFFFNCPVSEDTKQVIYTKLRELTREIEHMSEMDLNIKDRANASINIFIGAKKWLPEVVDQFKR